MASLTNTFGNVSAAYPAAGTPVNTGSVGRVESFARGTRVKQVTTVTISSAVDSTVYTVSIGPDLANLTEITYTSGVGATTTTIAAGLADAINANGAAGALVYATSSSAVITLTSRFAGQAFVVTESDSNIGTPSTTTSASSATTLPFGVMCQWDTSVASPRTAKQLDSTTAQAQVVTIAPTAENAAMYGVNVMGDFDGDGLTETYGAEYTADGSATDAEIVDALVARLNDQLPANSVLAANAADDLTLTAEIAGLPFKVTSYTSGSNAFDPVITTANITPVLAGLTAKAHVMEQDADGNAVYSNAVPLSVVREGEYFAELDAGLGSSDVYAGLRSAWVRLTASGSEVVGALRGAADSTDCLPLSAFGFKALWTTSPRTGFNGKLNAGLSFSSI